MTSMHDSHRSPTEVASPRMEALARLPVFFALHGKRVLVAGGSAAAAWKVELLAAAGAHVDVYATDPSGELLAAVATPQAGSMTLHRENWQQACMHGCVLAIGACETNTEARQFQAAAQVAGVPCNVIDKPDYCDFSFGAIVNRSPLVVAISTDGAAPVFAQAIRSRIEAMLPAGFARWADAARSWRGAVKQSGLSFNGRRLFWQVFTRAALQNPNGEPSRADFDALLELTETEAAAEQGSVTLVGAGPGDPELLTLRAVRALQSADVILYDDLVSKEVLDFARREAKRMLVGKTGHGPSCKQSEINSLMVGLAKSGRRVVRLKGGDPMIFGRAGEEIDACRKAGIAIDVVPGVTAAQGAAGRLGVSLTHRSTARRVQYLTGHDAHGQLPDGIDWRSVADPAATTVVYMPKKTLRAFADNAIAAGLDPATPALAIVNATRPNEQTVAATIGELADAALPDGPTIVMIGSVCALAGRVTVEPLVPADGSAQGAAR
ncbi:siroheme synthase CysG [Pseudorhodoplanes sp.]|uniref:siroheme synthase CysG n=1 Tax=Pseudorhodoplanes sp. TaxID=1934341 RepID=UPI002BC42B0C|nr:siroheme synthase CysG [Pseudorhodoplanes sp.]HWV51502.1 siroheme synthase CysG [Pseudorhodoplanes sp.]